MMMPAWRCILLRASAPLAGCATSGTIQPPWAVYSSIARSRILPNVSAMWWRRPLSCALVIVAVVIVISGENLSCCDAV
jgi:hypothetical protein